MSGEHLWRSWLAEDAKATIEHAASAAHPLETGGVLVGVIASGRPWITHAVEVRSPKSTRNSYELPAGRRQRAVIRLRRKDSRLGYLGEWHTHPADVGPSETDLATMARLAADSAAGCRRPLLLVARRVADGYELDAGQLNGRALRKIRLLASGPLPVAPDVPLRSSLLTNLLRNRRPARAPR